MFQSGLRMFTAVVLLLAISPGIRGETPDSDTWTQWRGPQRDGSVDAGDWPADLSEKHLSLGWSVPLGPSYSGPIVSDDHVFVTETVDKKYEVVRALDRASGEQIWEKQWDGALTVPFFAASNGSWIRATPALDGDRLYVAGMRDVLVCLDAVSGDVIWKRDFVADTGTDVPSFGFVSSPLIHGDHVYVQAGASFAKLNKLTGEIVWQTLNDSGGMYGSAFSSPVAATIDGVPQMVVQTRDKLAGVAPEDGKVLWTEEIPAFRGMNILTPTVIDNTIFTSSYGGRSTMFRISKSESGWKVEEIWNHKSQGYMSSPVLVDGQLYLHLRNQRCVSLNAETGEENWTSKPFGKYWSVIANGDRLLALDQRGDLRLIDASPEEFRLVDERKVADDSWAHIAVAGNQIFIRDLNALKVFTWR